jgi:hypothetical protein
MKNTSHPIRKFFTSTTPKDSLPDRIELRQLAERNEEAANRAQENLFKLLRKTLEAKPSG